MSDNFDKYQIFAEAYEKRVGKDVLAIIRRHTLTPSEFFDTIDFLENQVRLSLGTYECGRQQLERFTAKEQTDRLRGICQKMRNECARRYAELSSVRQRLEMCRAELRDYWAIQLPIYVLHTL
jgi:ribosomal protein S14